jgi:hypothetical protein
MNKITLVLLFLSVTAGGAETGKTVSAKPLSAPVMDVKVVSGQKACNSKTVCSPMYDRSGPPILNHAPAPWVEVAQLAGTPPKSPQRADSPPTTSSSGKMGPHYDVTSSAFGAKGDRSTDDTAAIQAAFNACWNNNATAPYGGIIEFPGNHTYVVSSTINAYDGCRIEGTIGSSSGGYSPVRIAWNGSPSAVGTTLTITNIDVELNCTTTAGTCIYSPAFPQISGTIQNRLATYYATVTAANSLAAGGWVEINGLTSQIGSQLNRCIGQVASATRNSFVVEIPCFLSASPVFGSTADSGTATTESVVFAFNGNARYEQEVSNIQIGSKTGYATNPYNVGLYFGSRVDTGTRIYNTWVGGSSEYSYYFAQGGINIDFGGGWRSDGAQVAAIYWRLAGGDNLELGTGTVDNQYSACFGQPSPGCNSGGVLMLDNTGRNGFAIVTLDNVKFESNTSLASSGTLHGGSTVPAGGLGMITLLNNPNFFNYTQLYLNLINTWNSPNNTTKANFNFPSIVVSPVNDLALNLTVTNSMLPAGTSPNTTVPFIGIPALSNSNMLGSVGYISQLAYAPSRNSSGVGPTGLRSPIQFIGDLNIGQLWQYGTKASDFLYSDTAFAALPSGTTLYAGQILAPPAYWSGANGKRYAMDVVYQTGTTGTLNSGTTTCTTPVFTISGVSVSTSPANVATFTGSWDVSLPVIPGQIVVTDSALGLSGTTLVVNVGATSTSFSAAYTHTAMNPKSDAGSGIMKSTLQCTSATGLSTGQRLGIGTDTNKTLQYVDASNASAPNLRFTSYLSSQYTAQTLSYSAPVLGLEIQMPTKSTAAPSTLAWSQGDTEQNSAAAANGVAAWVNVASGAPGSWAGIPLGDSSGKIAAAQLASSSTVGSGSVVLANQPTVNGLTGTGATTLTDLTIKGRCIGCTGASVRTAQAFCAGTASSSATILLFGAGSSQTACTQTPGPKALQQVIVATDGVLSNLAVRCGHLGSQPASGRFTVWDLPSGTAMLNASSGTNTGLAITIGNTAANANKTILDTQHTFAYAAGDMLRIQFTTEANETLGDCTASFNY